MKHFASIIAGLLLIVPAAFAQHAHGMHNDHDRMFADGMSKHHEDGIGMSRMAVEKAQSAEVRSIAQKMIDDQSREITQLQSLRGEGPRTTMEEMHKMPGMEPHSKMQQNMARLEAARGREFDLAFTEIMAKHHAGGVKMSTHHLEHGQSPELKEIARHIATHQAAEREQLLAMHDRLHAGSEAMTSATAERQRLTKD
jgi:uncharacterized protein (DUF305 family)